MEMKGCISCIEQQGPKQNVAVRRCVVTVKKQKGTPVQAVFTLHIKW